MNIAKFDWSRLIDQAAAWRGLSEEVRRRVKSNPRVSTKELASVAMDAKWLEFLATLERANPLAADKPYALGNYLSQWFDHQQMANLSRSIVTYGSIPNQVVALVSSSEWVRDFLGATSLTAWLQFHGARTRPLAALAESFGDAQLLAQAAIAWQAPVPLDDLAERVAGFDRQRAARALAVCAQFLVLFPGIRGDGAVTIDLLPSVGSRLRSTPPARPEAVAPEETFECAFALDDAIALVSAACRQNIRLRQNDGRIFAADEKAIVAEMIEAPSWLFPDARQAAISRLSSARQRVERAGLLRDPPKKKRRDELVPTPSAGPWLGSPRGQRLRAFLDAAKTRAGFEWEKLDLTVGIHSLETRPEYRDLLRCALLQLPTDDFWTLRAFLAWQATALAATPKLREWLRKHHVAWYSERLSVETLERMIRDSLLRTILGEMLPLGAVRIGFCSEEVSAAEVKAASPAARPFDDDDDDEFDDDDYDGDLDDDSPDGLSVAGEMRALAIRLTSAGQYMLGLRDDFEETARAAPEAQIVVQPNFEIAFLGRAPSQEAMISRYAERIGRGVGLLFRLTKASIVTYAAAGGDADAVLAELSRLAAKGVPKNVEREIRGWFGQCRRVSVRRSTVIECPDADTAARVRAVVGKEATPISDVLLEIPGDRLSPDMMRKLAKAGVFVE